MNKENTMDEFEKYLEKHITDMANYPEENGGRSMLKMALHEYRTFKARHKEDEPLAVLAARKGVSVEITPPSFYVKVGEAWEVGVAEPSKGLYTPFDGDTYAEAETKARAYLNGLPDVRAEKAAGEKGEGK